MTQKEYYKYPALEMHDELETPEEGLSFSEVKKRQEKNGMNELEEVAQRSMVALFLKQFLNGMVYVLIVAAVISGLLQHYTDVYIIGAVIIINAVIGFIQEYKAEQSIEALKKIVVLKAKVLREGTWHQIDARELVCGDIFKVEDGDKIPADGRLLEASHLRTIESSLTGESTAVNKNTDPIQDTVGIGDRMNMLWTGTFVSSGTGLAIVTAIGMDTAIGEIAQNIRSIDPHKSHFQEKTDALSYQLAGLAILMTAILFFIGYGLRGMPLEEIFLSALASLVSGIPEGLPAVLVIVLAIGARRMADKNAIIRSLPVTETLSVTDVIITDKTGTLTQNTMTIQKMWVYGQSMISLTGEGWSDEGSLIQDSQPFDAQADPQVDFFTRAMGMSVSAEVTFHSDTGTYQIMGDPTEAAFVVASVKAGIPKEQLHQEWRRVDDMPFRSEMQYRASLVRDHAKNIAYVFVLGASEKILSMSSDILDKNGKIAISKDIYQEVLGQADSLSEQAMRVLTLAYKELPYPFYEIKEERDMKDLTVVGMVGMIDPPRPEVVDAIRESHEAGVRVIMATGDHKKTALAIGESIGLVPKGSRSVDQTELEALTEDEFQQVVKEVSVFARLSPQMKLKIAETLQSFGHVIAMTGDGVNDAPALKKADVGISMGQIGTDVARESSDIILADDNFSTIIHAIEEGRIIFRNVKQTSIFLVTTSVAQVVAIMVIIALGYPLPLTAVQILLLNIVTGGLMDISLATEPGHGDILKDPPMKKHQGILSLETIPLTIFMTSVILIPTVLIFLFIYDDTQNIFLAQTAAFTMVAFAQLFNAFNLRSLHRSVFEIGVFTNKYVIWGVIGSLVIMLLAVYLPIFEPVFNFVPLSIMQVAVIAVISSGVLWLGELYKWVMYKK